ncbi:MAG: CocE/NonD family hydrolase [Lentisphaeria bacterium]|nr:CocE/NonD family hydrolase [Lentisphaeria bacterium]
MKIIHTFMPTRDGVNLATDVYLPDLAGEYPLIIIRSPYYSAPWKPVEEAEDFCRQGVGMLIQDCRGTGRSEGEADYWRQENFDGEDLLRWLMRQKFFNGRAVTNGESYPGGTQYQAARCSLPQLVGITPHNAPWNIYQCHYVNGVPKMSLFVWAFGMRKTRMNYKDAEVSAVNCLQRPIKELDSKLFNVKWPLYQTWLKHLKYDEYWRRANAGSCFERMLAPGFITGGWFDIFIRQTMEAFRTLRRDGASRQCRDYTRCVIEPLDHDMRTHEVDYGADYLADIIENRNKFMVNILRKPTADPLPNYPLLRLFIMGINEYRDFDYWPPRGGETRHFYLNAAGGLTSVPDPVEYIFHYTYDPNNPVPTWGGNHLGYLPCGQREQSRFDSRQDIIFFRTEQLETPLNLVGDFKITLYVSSDAKCTDFTAKLMDEYPDGRSYNICDSIQRVHFSDRNSGEIKELKFSIGLSGIVILREHRLKLAISSSNYPAYENNLNNGESFEVAINGIPAQQQIHTGANYPSCLELPVFKKL